MEREDRFTTVFTGKTKALVITVLILTLKQSGRQPMQLAAPHTGQSCYE